MYKKGVKVSKTAQKSQSPYREIKFKKFMKKGQNLTPFLNSSIKIIVNIRKIINLTRGGKI